MPSATCSRSTSGRLPRSEYRHPHGMNRHAARLPHHANFGTFRAPDGHAVWGLSDYDQTGAGSPEADLERLAASAVLAARQAKFPPKVQEQLARNIADAYFSSMHDLAGSWRSDTA